MSGHHSIIQHRPNYFFLKIEEDYTELFRGKSYQHCKAAILSMLEQWMNNKRFEGCTDDDLFIYMSYPGFVNHLFGLFGRSTVIRSLEELIDEKIILSRPYIDSFHQSTFEYRIDIDVLNKRLAALPERPVGSVKINGGSVKINGGSVKINDPHVKVNDRSSKNKRGGSVKVNDRSSKNKRQLDTNLDTNLDITANTTSPKPLTTSVVPLPPFSSETDASDDDAVQERRRGIYQRIVARRGYEIDSKARVGEYVAIKQLAEKYTDEQIEAIHRYLFETDWRWSKPDNRYKIGACIIAAEAQNVLQILKTREPSSPPVMTSGSSSRFSQPGKSPLEQNNAALRQRHAEVLASRKKGSSNGTNPTA